ncbi:autotransporter assembly complex protein TamB [Lonepinella koalarum]|uniref:Autotransporter secretion inner membrane protein TamB n=1 Tax=Lonepinella koalarum TaxID=53417 RepID=A0A4R1L0F9_9PAST|nr:translocation/assembly module TamB domain-containing protein [Lonepinella koalarum]MDH2926123.1 tubulin-binding protein [Lonepinella koalarum]TCK71274.1 autotransporter secretion inner membrane protein TamB [Lonepinella koalarum]TFJ90994.1 translocation/assembly module TamB [Lonepinella koalarum]
MTEPVQQNENVPQSSQLVGSKKSKFLHRSLVAIGVLVGIAGAAGLGVAGIVGSESGTQWAIGLADKYVDGLTIGDVQGKLQHGLLLKDVQFQSAGVETNIAQAELKFDFGCLLKADICIENLQVQQPAIHIDTSKLPPSEPEPEQENSAMQRITLPVSIAVKNVEVDNLALGIDSNQMHLGKFHTAVFLNNEDGLTLEPTQINDLAYIFADSSEKKEEINEEHQPSEPVNWQQIEQSLTPALLANVSEIILPFDLHIPDILGKDWQYQQVIDGKLVQQIDVPKVQIQVDATGATVALQTLQIDSSVGNIQAQGNIQLDQAMPLNLTVHADLDTIKQGDEILLPKSVVDLSISGDLKKNTALSLTTQGVADAILNADVQLNSEKTPLNLTLNVPKFSYPFNQTDDPLNVQNVTLNVTGNLLDYQLTLHGNVKGMSAPTTDLALQANGGISHTEIEKLQLNALDGALGLMGKLNWRDGVEWQAETDLNKINLGAYLSSFPAILSGKLTHTGQVKGERWAIAMPELNIQGSLSKNPLSLKGSLTSDNQVLLNTSQISLNYGVNHIVATGTLTEQSDFLLDINAPNLKGLLPDLSASVIGKAYIKGKLTEPNLVLDLTGNNIQFQDLKIAKVIAKGEVSTEQQIQGDLNVELNGFSQGEIKLNNAKLTASGNEKSHQLQLHSSGEPVAGGLNLSGSFDRGSQVWKGTLSQVGVNSPIGEVKNSQNIDITFDNKQTLATISSHCWKHADIDLCFPQTFKVGTNGEIPFDLKRLNLALVNKLTEQDGLLQGILRSSGSLAWNENKPLKLDVQLNGDGVNVAQKMDYRTFKLAVPRLALNAQLDNDNLQVKSDIQIQNNGRINADMKINDIINARKLSGTFNINGVNLNLANQLLSNGEQISGSVTSHLTFAGDLTAPLLNGSFNINQLKAKLKSSPVEVTGGEVALNFYGNRSTLKGDIQTVDSHLVLEGDADWKNIEQWNARVNAQADKFFINIPAIAKLRASPNVTVTATPKLLALSGNIDIPWARIEVESLPESAVAVSSDEVILENLNPLKNGDILAARQMATTTESGMLITSDLDINIGKDVNVKAYGLDSNLEGRLAVRQEKGALGLYGQVDLKHGRYASFGQDLIIRKGQISFSGLPSQPLLNIEAIRNPEAMEDSKVTAGIKVTGVADAPRVEVFSEPSLPQDQALSYILTGRSLESSGEAGSSGSVGAALLGIGLAKSGKLVGGIGEVFGIQDLNLGTAGVGDSSKVVVSGNITPRLKIKYGVGLFDGLAEVTLRYRLFPQFFLQSVSGVNQAFDVLYEFEF